MVLVGGELKVKFVVHLPSSSRMITITQKLGEARLSMG